jgi:hypothetical protein
MYTSGKTGTHSEKADQLLNAYFSFPLQHYVRVVASIKASGGLNQDEVRWLKGQALAVDVSTMLRHLNRM